MEDLSRAYYGGKASAVAAGSLFVHSGKNKGILVNYPEKEELEEIFDPKFSKNL
jgi:cyclase